MLHPEQQPLLNPMVWKDPAPGWEISVNSIREQVLLFEAATDQSL